MNTHRAGASRMPRDFIYARVSTEDQDTESQIVDLKQDFPNAMVIREVASGVKRRPQLEELIESIRPGDRLIVAALDRIGRSLIDSAYILEKLANKGVTIISKLQGTIDQSTSTGKFYMQLWLSIAEMERNRISERTKDGLKRVRAAGVKVGRPRGISDERWEAARRLKAAGAPHKEIAAKIGISEASVSRYFRGYQHRD